MNTFSKVLLISTTAFAGMSVQAEIVCKGCQYVQPATYIGSYWVGDRGTFNNLAIPANTEFDNYYIFDVNEPTHAWLVLSTLNGRQPLEWTIAIYPDTGTTCVENVCGPAQFIEGTASLSGQHLPGYKYLSAKVQLYPGRHVLRIGGITKPDVALSYKGTLRMRQSL